MLPGQASEPTSRRRAGALLRLRIEPRRRGDERTAQSRRARLAAAVGTGLLLAAAFPPIDLGPLALVGLIPLLWAWRGAGPGEAALCGFIAGVAFFAVLVEWTRYFGTVAVVPFVVALSSWWALGGAVVGWLGRRGVASPPVVAAVWVLIESARGRIPLGGFPWGDIGYAFHDFAPVRALAGWGGVALVSWMAVALNGWLLDTVLAWRAPPPRAWRRPFAGILAVLAVGALGAAALPALTPTGRLAVAMVQGNDRNRDPTREETLERYIVRNHLRLAASIDRPVDLIVLPESALDADPRQDAYLDQELTSLAASKDADVLAGGNTKAPQGGLSNSVTHYTGDGRTTGFYSKRHLVPFGEYVPWRSALSFIEELEQVPTDYEPGPGPGIFRIDGHAVGTLICFESAFADLSRQYARLGADVLVVPTNNRSYRRSANSAQHLAMGQFRAAETGRPLLQAAISGITAVIDHTGRVQSQTKLFEPTVLFGEVEAYRGRTPYTAVGEWVPIASGLLLGGSLISGALIARRRRVLDSPG